MITQNKAFPFSVGITSNGNLFFCPTKNINGGLTLKRWTGKKYSFNWRWISGLIYVLSRNSPDKGFFQSIDTMLQQNQTWLQVQFLFKNDYELFIPGEGITVSFGKKHMEFCVTQNMILQRCWATKKYWFWVKTYAHYLISKQYSRS